MKKQTYLIETFDKHGKRYDFYRVGCKKVGTCLGYLKNWRDEAIKQSHWLVVYKEFADKESTYTITATPDGYNKTNVVATGKIFDL